MKLYGVSPSPFVRKVIVALHEKGIAFEHQPVMPGDSSPEFRAISPLGQIPGLVDGDFKISDSTAILHYLDAIKPEPSLYLTDARERARVVFYEKFADTRLIPTAAKIFQQRIVFPRFFGQQTDEAILANAIDVELPPLLDHLTNFIGDKSFLMGDRFTVADIACASIFANTRYAQYTPDPARWPKVAAYIDRVFARPSYAKALEADKAMFGG
jgi:glutathione S-transferase